MPTRIVAPLTGTVSKGTWITNQRLNVPTMPNGFIQYNVLLPANYSTAFLYPVLFYGHENSEGISGGSYPADGANLVNQTVIDGTFNTIAFRTAFPCIVVVPECDQTLDPNGANPNANFGGYADTPNSGGNEQGVNALFVHILATWSGDPTRGYCTGDSLGAIASCAWTVDNNAYAGIYKQWAAGMGFSDQLFRPNGVPNSQVFPAMVNVPYIAVSTPFDNNEDIYDMAAWRHFTNGGTNYPTEAAYASGGVAAIKAGSSSFYYIRMTSSQMPWEVYRQLDADGGKGTALYKLLFSFTSGPQPPTPLTGTNMTVLTPTSGGSLTDTAGNVWTLPGGTVTENGTAVAGGAGTAAFTISGGNTYWGLDGSSGNWFTFSLTTQTWTQQTGKPPVVPNQVTGLTAGTVTSTSVPLSWTAPILATGYNVEMSTAGGAFVSIGTPTVTTFTATGLLASTAYAFQVAGTDSTGTGAFSTPVSATTSGGGLAVPGQPTGLTGTVISATEIDYTWTASTTGGAAASYTLEATANGGALATIATGISGTSFHATGLLASTTYVADVKGLNATGAGAASATFSASTLPAVPGAPTSLTVGNVTSTSVDLSWSAPTTGGPVSVYLVDDEVSGGTFGQVFSGSTLSATIVGLLPSTVYVFEALASNAGGTGPASPSVTATTLPGVTKASVQVQIATAEGLATQLSTLLVSINTNVGQL